MEIPEDCRAARCRNSGVMKKRILTQFVAAAAGIALPLSVIAQDYSDQTSSGSPDASATSSGSLDQSSGSNSSGGSFSGNNQSLQSQPGTFSGGIMVHDGAAYIVHRLQNEMSLPNGSKIQPNGTIHESDGSTRNISSGKILTLDGREMEAPFHAEQGSSSSGSSEMSNPSNMPGSSSSLPGSSSSPSSMPPSTSTPSEDFGTSGENLNQPGSGSSSGADSNTQNSGSGSLPGSVSTKDGTELH